MVTVLRGSDSPAESTQPIGWAMPIFHLIAGRKSCSDELPKEDLDLGWYPSPPQLPEVSDHRPMRQTKVDRPTGVYPRRLDRPGHLTLQGR
jgi:hypothetical protein